MYENFDAHCGHQNEWEQIGKLGCKSWNIQNVNILCDQSKISLICRSCPFDRASIYEFGVEFWMFALIFFSADIKIGYKRRTIHFYKGVLTQKRYF